ncbi:MAG: phosphatase PAP2 family protein [Polyangiaceae bacterium]|nr:phosphatase PAP2 family protein [Polyangiaceae bacterium]
MTHYFGPERTNARVGELQQLRSRTSGSSAVCEDVHVSVPPSASAVASGIARGRTSLLSRIITNLAVQDYFIAGYFLVLLFALAVGTGPGREACVRTVLGDLGFFCTGIVLTRGGILREGTMIHALVYRLCGFLPVFLSYFQLRHILPAVAPTSVDAHLVALDLRIFGVEPALAWDRFVTANTTEWFAFFYFSYFFLLTVHVIPLLLNASSRIRLAHFAFGVFIVVCFGHIGYMLVPGWGPYRALAGQFQHPLVGGFFWNLVKATVDAGGSQKDIFPSLHTALPTYFAIFSFMHRRHKPFRYTWPILAFTVTQIIIATMFLRWHYLIDIVAGLTLAITAALVSYRVVLWETARRDRLGLEPIYSIVAWPWSTNAATDSSKEFGAALREHEVADEEARDEAAQ